MVVETDGKLKDRVQVNGRTESHPEGVYYIEWRDNGQRRRQAVPNRNEVLEQARLKALELEAARIGMQTVFSPPSAEAQDRTYQLQQGRVTQACRTDTANKTRNQVNVLKKVKVKGQWKLCPVVAEPDGKLKDRVQVNGSAEVHSEGVYYRLCPIHSNAEAIVI